MITHANGQIFINNKLCKSPELLFHTIQDLSETKEDILISKE